MRALIIEDDEDKLADIAEYLAELFPEVEIAEAKSLQSGKHSALEAGHDVILLDMTMRNFDRTAIEDGGRPHSFAGREILRQMRRHRVTTKVIVVTHFDRFGDENDYVTLDALKQELSQRFENYVGTVQYRSNVDDWRPALAALLEAIVGG